ncbi:hypothetical protein [Microtetraspora niveoalba]|uniref:hypothetical protein n=1 Tax=Microtetraspora niveoalba TaxID=46175 RepID=UPI00082F6631|nr:hypothetical protein [Microtetraspora niveoalba]
MFIGDLSGRSGPDACPGALQIHAAADGGLARIRVPGGAVTAHQLRVVAAAARELGSGVIELTSRANLQVRGLPLPPEATPGPGGAACEGAGPGDGGLGGRASSRDAAGSGDAAGRGGAQDFAARLAAAGLLPSATHERARNIVASALAGRSPDSVLDVRPLAAELDRALCARPGLAALPGRFLFALDDGSGDVAGLGADVTLLPSPPESDAAPGHAGSEDAGPGFVGPGDAGPGAGPGLAGSDGVRPGAAEPGAAEPGDAEEVALLLAGVDHGLRVPAGAATEGMLAVAEAFLAERAEQGSQAWRLSELVDGPGRVAARAARSEPRLRLAAARPSEPSRPCDDAAGGSAVGVRGQRDGRAALTVLAPLGRLTAAQVEALAEAADDGAGEVRLTPWRAVVVPDLPPGAADAWRAGLAEKGLVTDPASPWLGVTACAGRPGCAKSLADVHADIRAALPAPRADADVPGDAVRSPSVGGGPLPVHWAGCERRCGRPRGRVVDVIATVHGYRVEADGVSRTFADAEQTSAAVAATREGQ